MEPLHRHLEGLYAATDATERLRVDPVGLVHRYRTPEDQEVAAVFAALLAFGRVAGFRPVLVRVLAQADARGGPRAWVDGFDTRAAEALQPIVHRWTRGPELALLCEALQRAYRDVPSLEACLGEGTTRAALTALVHDLRARAAAAAGVGSAAGLSRGFRHLLADPTAGSACKRWNMFLRWMVRPTTEGIDLGLWTRIRPAELVIPLDTHVLRISRFLGLTARRDGSWRTAAEVTDALRRFDPVDPVRFDFGLAHLGISGACRGHRVPEVCPGCPLDPVCAA